MTLPSQSAGRTVPLDPTKEMIEAAFETGAFENGMFQVADISVVAAYQAMLRAAPEAPDLLAENSKLKGQLEEAVGALEQIAGPKFKGCRFESNTTVTGFHVGVQVERSQEIALAALSKLKEAGS